MDSHFTTYSPPAMSCENSIHGMCTGKTWQLSERRYPQAISTARNRLPVENTLHCNLFQGMRKRLRLTEQNRYHPLVCSTLEGAIDPIERIAAAIDQVARDAHDLADEPALTARIAEIWLMLGTLDPNLARRQQKYTMPVDGGPHRGGAPSTGHV